MRACWLALKEISGYNQIWLTRILRMLSKSFPSPTCCFTASSPASSAAFFDLKISTEVSWRTSTISLVSRTGFHGKESTMNRLNQGEPILLRVGRRYIEANIHLVSVGLSCSVSTANCCKCQYCISYAILLAACVYRCGMVSSVRESKEHPRPLWPTNSSAVLDIHDRTSI